MTTAGFDRLLPLYARLMSLGGLLLLLGALLTDLSWLGQLTPMALVFMVFNHTARWWIERPMGWPRYHLVYLTVPLAAPIFRFNSRSLSMVPS